LGALSADLGYLNMYEKTGTAVNLLSSINRLADALQIGQFFDFTTIKRLATTNSDLDSLLFISMNSFNNMDDYLRETDRSNLSALMIAGVWMEGTYLATQVALQTDNEDLKTMIGEQKLILNNLLAVLNNYNNEPAIASYIADLETIKAIYDEVKITYEVGEPETIEKDGMLMVVQSETSHVEMSDELLQRIIDTTQEIRNKQLNIKAEAV
jgi:regulator of RNase E activity RraB